MLGELVTRWKKNFHFARYMHADMYISDSDAAKRMVAGNESNDYLTNKF